MVKKIVVKKKLLFIIPAAKLLLIIFSVVSTRQVKTLKCDIVTAIKGMPVLPICLVSLPLTQYISKKINQQLSS